MEDVTSGQVDNSMNNGSLLLLTNKTEMVSTEKMLPIMIHVYVNIPIYTVIFGMCVLGNLLVIVTLLLQNQKTVTNVFLINLAIGDLLFGVFCMPVTLAGQLFKRFIFGYIMCKLLEYFQVACVIISSFTLCGISIERFFAICHPMTSRRWQTVSHSLKMIVIIWLMALIIAFPSFYFSWYFKDVTFNALFITLFGLPGIFMTLTYSKIMITLFTGLRRGEVSTNSQTNLQAKKKGILMLIIILVEFFICFTPFWLVNIMGFFDPQGIDDHVGEFGKTYLQLLMYLSTCCNPITYCFLQSSFRQGMIKVFTCRKEEPAETNELRVRREHN